MKFAMKLKSCSKQSNISKISLSHNRPGATTYSAQLRKFLFGRITKSVMTSLMTLLLSSSNTIRVGQIQFDLDYKSEHLRPKLLICIKDPLV